MAALVIVLSIIILVFGYEVITYRRFDASIRQDICRLFSESVREKPSVVTEAMLESVPEPIQRYLRYTGVVGKPIPRIVRLKQRGRLRTDPRRPWMNIAAEEYYSIKPPSFVWAASAAMGGIPLLRGRDRYRAGEGCMNIKLLSAMDVVNASGAEIDQGAMMRYLSEIIGFPAAFLGDNIRFEALDRDSAKVILADCGKSVSGTLFVDEEGKLTDFVALRYADLHGKHTLETWSTPITGYGEFEGLRLPNHGKAVWKLQDGDFDYIEVEITDLQYDVEQTY